MDCWNINLTLFSFLLLLLFPFSTATVTATSSHVTSNQFNTFQDIACSTKSCGQGTCKASKNPLLGFVCECYPRWKKIQKGLLPFASCLIPNCTVDFHCDNESPSAPPPPASLPPPSNQTNDCGTIWCGDGKCETNGTGYICHCNQGSKNLLNSSDLPCLKPCNLGADCQDLGLDLPLGRRRPSPKNNKRRKSEASNNRCFKSYFGLKGVLNCLGTLPGLTAIVVVAACLPWF